MRNKSGQVTLFILVGIVIVSAILVFFLWVQPTYLSEGVERFGFEGCVQDVLEEGVLELEGNAGFIEPGFSYSYDGEEYVYLCYTEDYYETCTVQVPFLKNNFDEQLERYVRDGVDVCYENSLGELRDQGYNVVSGAIDYNVEIEPGVVRMEIEAPTSLGTQRFSRFNIELSSPLYNMLMIATSILQFEARYGDSDTSAFTLLYPDYFIDKVKRDDGTTVYALENRGTGDKFNFASRSLAWPAGYDFGGE
ncbi:hypothetical protein HNV12_03450 [Methanococcoides sp. SA1]|nr:hypothetical protein [Methanococcoides sp. SA1]